MQSDIELNRIEEPSTSTSQSKEKPNEPKKAAPDVTEETENARPFSVEWLMKYSPSLVLENKGATARDHLANERTFLAYLRTSLSVVTVGVAVTQLLKLSPTSTPAVTDPVKNVQVSAKALGAVFIALGFIFILFGVARYFFAQQLLVKGLFPASRMSVIFGSVFLLLTTVAAFVLTLLI